MARHPVVSGLLAMLLVGLAMPAAGIYIGVESRRVPVARLVTNLEKQLASRPDDPGLHLKLARLYGMAYALNSEEVPVVTGRQGTEEVWFGHEPNLMPHRTKPQQEGTRIDAARAYLSKSLEHYRRAVALEPGNLMAGLGLGWALEQSSDKAGAIAAYRTVVEKAWPKERMARTAELGQRFFTAEAASYLIPLLDPKSDVREIEELRRRAAHLESIPRPITPLVIPLRDRPAVESIVDLGASVRFDADGTGRQRSWTWITPEAGWLVYDGEGKGRISSALQWFGDATFWLPWSNGYEALCSLDDDGDGEVSGPELRFLAVWHDRDRDGISSAGEVQSLQTHGVVALSCRHEPGDGLLTAATSEAGMRLANGRSRPTYDVILRPAWLVSSAKLASSLTPPR